MNLLKLILKLLFVCIGFIEGMFWFNVLPLNDIIDSTGDTDDIIVSI